MSSRWASQFGREVRSVTRKSGAEECTIVLLIRALARFQLAVSVRFYCPPSADPLFCFSDDRSYARAEATTSIMRDDGPDPMAVRLRDRFDGMNPRLHLCSDCPGFLISCDHGPPAQQAHQQLPFASNLTKPDAPIRLPCGTRRQNCAGLSDSLHRRRGAYSRTAPA